MGGMVPTADILSVGSHSVSSVMKSLELKKDNGKIYKAFE